MEYIDIYKENTGKKITSIKQMDDWVVVCVCNEFMRRFHAVTPQGSQIMFVDATRSLDRLNHQILKLMTESPIGGLHLGFIILSEQTEYSLTEGFFYI